MDKNHWDIHPGNIAMKNNHAILIDIDSYCNIDINADIYSILLVYIRLKIQIKW